MRQLKRFKIQYLPVVVLVLVGLMFFITACGGKAQPGPGKAAAPQPESHKHQRYHCPMHPTYTSDKPGECPICGMNLVPIPETTKTPGKKVTKYRSTMNPQEISDKPGKDSMGMDMVPFEVEESDAAGAKTRDLISLHWQLRAQSDGGRIRPRLWG